MQRSLSIAMRLAVFEFLGLPWLWLRSFIIAKLALVLLDPCFVQAPLNR